MKGSLPEHRKHYVKYIATREGVEKIDDTQRLLPVTKRQEQFIQQMLNDFPDAKKLLEYEDYLAHPDRGHASQLIEQTMEIYAALSEKRENYVDYIATRPGVERQGSHGLFTDQGKSVVLADVQKEAAEQKGVIWTHVVSLRREDAARLGYDNARAWRALLRSKRAMFCREMKIDSKNLNWYAAFHNESHHPHVHIMVYSKDPSEGYLSKKAIQNMRSEFAHDIFRQEFLQIYEEQADSRETLLKKTEQILSQLEQQDFSSLPDDFSEHLLQLSERLRHTKGKKVYGYLKADMKRLVDGIVDQLAETDEIKEAYQVWVEWQQATSEVYGQVKNAERKLSEEKKLKVIKNMVIRSAWTLLPEPIEQPLESSSLQISEDDAMINPLEEAAIEKSAWTAYREGYRFFYGDGVEQDENVAEKYLLVAAAQGNGRAEILLGRIYGNRDSELFDSEKAIQCFLPQAQSGNPFAQYYLGKFFWQERDTEDNKEQAIIWLQRAAEQGHIWARISLGRIHSNREEEPLYDYDKAMAYLVPAAEQGNSFAQYYLGRLFWQEQEQGENKKLAIEWLEQSAGQKNIWARLFLDRILGYPTGTKEEYRNAIAALLPQAKQKQANGYVQYLLGKLYWQEQDTEEDKAQAVYWLEKAAGRKIGSAQVLLGRIYSNPEEGRYDFEKAIEYLQPEAEQENVTAQYLLGKLYWQERQQEENRGRALEWLEKAAEQNYSWARILLGRIYGDPQESLYDFSKAVNFLLSEAEEGNNFAQYQLGRLYWQERTKADHEKQALFWLQQAATQGNQYAVWFLEAIQDSFHRTAKQQVNALLRDISSLFSSELQAFHRKQQASMDKKRRQKLREKRAAAGQKAEDSMESQTI